MTVEQAFDQFMERASAPPHPIDFNSEEGLWQAFEAGWAAHEEFIDNSTRAHEMPLRKVYIGDVP